MGAIDLTARYDNDRWMTLGRATWVIDRRAQPVSAVVLHHSAGWYGAALDADASDVAELAFLDAMAADHVGRFGIGPGYHYVAFPSGRLYAVGKWGTQRAHARGWNAVTGTTWNIDAIGVCAAGNYEAAEPTSLLLGALTAAVTEVRTFARQQVPMFSHGRLMTADAAGRTLDQATACPGSNLIAWLDTLDPGSAPPAVLPTPTVPAATGSALRAAVTQARQSLDEAMRLLDGAEASNLTR